ncbi:MAG: hypothetical protein NC548_57950 [Lachnospiraceae bacterium]|nr:hypothetical protein [Lachnospiraceae bacterium]
MAEKVLRHSAEEIDTALEMVHSIDERVSALEENPPARSYGLVSADLKGADSGIYGDLITESEV